MRTRNPTVMHQDRLVRGAQGRRAGTPGPIFHTGEGTPEYLGPDVELVGATLEETEEGVRISFDGIGQGFVNDSGEQLEVGTVVVVQTDGTIDTTTTAQDIRPVGVVQRSTDDGFEAPIIFVGYVAQVNTTGTVNSGEYLETSTSAGLARASAVRQVGSFGQALADGPNPPAIIWSPPDPVTGTGSGSAVGRRCLVHNSGAQSIANSTETTVTFDTEDSDVNGMHAAGTFTPPAGNWKVTVNWAWAASTGGDYRAVYVRMDTGPVYKGSDQRAPTPSLGYAAGSITVDLLGLSGADSFKITVAQNSGGNLNLYDGLQQTTVSVVELV